MSREVLVAGETLVDFIPDNPGPLADVERFARRAGGAPANVAAALATLDRSPLFWTRVGDDPFGEHVLDALRERGVREDHFKVDLGARTTLAFVGHGADGEPSFTFYREGAADTRLEPGGVPDATLSDCSWVHVGGVTLADDPARSATMDLAERAADRGCTVSVDPNYRPELWADADYATRLDRLLALADVVKASPDDLRAAGLDGDPPSLARAVRDRGPHTAFVTLGDGGPLAAADGDAPWADAPAEVEHDGFAVDAVDTTGAGDAFTAGAIASLRTDAHLGEALSFASAVAALATTEAGAMAALPDRTAVERMRESEA